MICTRNEYSVFLGYCFLQKILPFMTLHVLLQAGLSSRFNIEIMFFLDFTTKILSAQKIILKPHFREKVALFCHQIYLNYAQVIFIIYTYQRFDMLEIKKETLQDYTEKSGNKIKDSSPNFNSQLSDLQAIILKMRQFFIAAEKKLEDKREKINNSGVVFQYCQKFLNWDIGSCTIQRILKKHLSSLRKRELHKKNWKQNDVRILVWVVNTYCIVNQIQDIFSLVQQDWSNISQLVPGKNANSCMFKILSLKEAKINQYPWQKEQSRNLQTLIRQNPNIPWKQISQLLYFLNKSQRRVYRNPKQCKQHYQCYLNPIIHKGPWKVQEDIIVLQFLLQKGFTKKWRAISNILFGRTQNSVKNRFSLLIQKELKHHDSELTESELCQSALKRAKNKIEILQKNASLKNLAKIKLEEQHQKPKINIKKKQKVILENIQPQIKVQNQQNLNPQNLNSLLAPPLIYNPYLQPLNLFIPYQNNMYNYCNMMWWFDSNNEHDGKQAIQNISFHGIQ